MNEHDTVAAARAGALIDGRYRLEELIGEGAMGTVWRASDESLERTVAVKLFRAGIAGETDAVRRESEKKLLASLSHPALVTLFDARISERDASYLVMEYIAGGTLADRVAQGAVSPRDAASLTADLGEALHVVHMAGIIHRDVKPGNILLRPPITPPHSFRAVLADFGIAYLVDAARVTTPGTTIGTAAYISPEQVRGHAPSAASDIYSLGLVLVEALSGVRAFPQRTPAEAVAARLTASPIISGEWGYGWRSLLTAMTALNPEDRPTAREVAARGRELDSGSPSPEETAAMTQASAVAASSPTSAQLPRPPQEQTVATKVLVAEPTEVVRAGGIEALPSADAAPNSAADAEPRRRRWRVPVIITAVILAVAGVILAVSLANGVSTAPTPPDLPQVEEPLGTHLQELLVEVTP